MITIDVKVYGGVAPLPIRVFIDNIANFDDIRFSRDASFTESFQLANGEYYIIISGSNPPDGKTIVTVSGTDSAGNSFKFTKTKTGDLYSVLNYVKI